MEGAEWILTGLFVAAVAVTSGAIGLAVWAERRKARREAWEAEHPHEQVEPPRVPDRFRYIERDALEPADRAELDRLHTETLKQPPAADFDGSIGDMVLTFVDAVVDGERVHAWVAARLVWPRETYVRARVVARHDVLDGHFRPGDSVDVPRDGIASIVRLTGLPLAEPGLGTC